MARKVQSPPRFAELSRAASGAARPWQLLLALALLLGAPAITRAQLINIGTAANFAGLELDAGSTFTISKSTTVVSGDAGVASNSTLNFSGGSVITGTIYAGAGATLDISGGSGATGGIVNPYSGMAQAVTDANNAASYYAGLTPNQTLGSITGGTFNGTGGLNVYDVTGNLSLSNTNLTISGNASDTFVFNISGTADLSRSNIVLSGVSASQVLFNLIGTGTTLTTSGDSDTAGIFLSENGAFNIQGGVHNSDFISGGDLTWQSGVNVTQATGLSPVPELGRGAMYALSGGLLALLIGIPEGRRRRAG